MKIIAKQNSKNWIEEKSNAPLAILDKTKMPARRWINAIAVITTTSVANAIRILEENIINETNKNGGSNCFHEYDSEPGDPGTIPQTVPTKIE